MAAPSVDSREEHVAALQAEVTALTQSLAAARAQRADALRLLDTSPLAVTHLRRDGTILSVNTTGARNLGGLPAQFEGANLQALLPDIAEQTRGRLERTFDTRQPLSVETAVRLPSGERWFRSTYCPVFDEGGVPLSVQLVSQDITELKRMEQLLEATEGRLSSVLEHAPHIVVLLDPDGVVRYVNRVPTGYTNDQVLGATAATTLPIASAQAFAECRQRAVSTKESQLIEVDDLYGRHWEVRLAPILRGGELHQLVAFAVDVSERRNARERERELQAQVQHAQKIESLGVLAGGIAHDFNNLLVGILGNAELALRHEGDGEVGEQLRGIVQAAQRAAGLCRQMLAYAGRHQLALEPLDLATLADEMFELVRASLSKRARFVRECPAGLPAIEGDPSQLRQVIMNLLTNASDALVGGEGEIALRCGVAAGPSGVRSVYVEVADSGCGMDADTRRRMFEPFFTTKRLGSGLGLASALGIVRSHHGNLHVDSVEGRGTTVRAVFPEARPRSNVDARRVVEEPRPSPCKVLLVDDEPTVRRVAMHVLRDAGHQVVEAADGVEALQRFDADPASFDAAVLDLSMPRMDGDQTLAALRKRAPDLAVVLASGFEPSPDERARWSSDPLTRFVAKPYSLDALLSALDEARKARGEQLRR